MRKSLSKLSVWVMIFVIIQWCMCFVSFAGNGTANENAAVAIEAITNVGLIEGDSSGITDSYLNKTTKRYQLAILFLRLNGLENEAINYTSAVNDNFSDAKLLSPQNQAILLYLKHNPDLGWAKGKKFEPLKEVTTEDLYKVLLQALEYEAGVDFDENNVIEFANSIGITHLTESKKVTNKDVILSLYQALKLNVKGTEMNLATKLAKMNIISANSARESGFVILPPGYKIVGYIPAWKEWDASKIMGDKLTHLNLAFAAIKDGVIDNGKDINDKHFNELKKLKEKYPHLKILISVGGWGADGFSDAALTEESRNKFADSVVEYLRVHNLDGIDVDWEYPVNGGWGTIKARPEDKVNFTLLMRTLREKLDKAGQEDNKYYILSFAASINPSYYKEWTEFDKVVEIADFVNVMEYDVHGPWDKVTGHLSALELSDKDNTGICGSSSIKGMLEAGASPDKLVYGFPFYGYYWTDVEKNNNGLYQKVNGNSGEVSYEEILAKYNEENGFKRYWDEKAKAAYLWNEEKGIFVTYEDPEAIAEEIAFIAKNNLGGAMFWEYTHDFSGTLLNTIVESLWTAGEE